MPSGKVHNKLWKKGIRLSFIGFIGMYIVLDFLIPFISNPFSCISEHCFSISLVVLVGSLSGYLLGKWITPDLDLFGITQNEWDVVKKGKLLGLFFVIYWLPYGYIFKGRHRSFWTHSYIWSTLLRVIYGFFWVYLLGVNIGIELKSFLIFGLFIGLLMSDSIHIWADHNYKGE